MLKRVQHDAIEPHHFLFPALKAEITAVIIPMTTSNMVRTIMAVSKGVKAASSICAVSY